MTANFISQGKPNIAKIFYEVLFGLFLKCCPVRPPQMLAIEINSVMNGILLIQSAILVRDTRPLPQRFQDTKK